MKKIFILSGILFLLLNFSSTSMAYDLNLGKCVANLESRISNDYYVQWYEFVSPTTGKRGIINAPEVIATIFPNETLNINMWYQVRDDSKLRGEIQEVKLDIWRWDPVNYRWAYVATGGQAGEFRSAEMWGTYNKTGTLYQNNVMPASQNVAKFKIVAKAKSGGETTCTRYIWVARAGVINLSNTDKAVIQWRCSRYERSALYKQLANAWRAIKASSDTGTGQGFKEAMDQIIDLGKEFVVPTPADLGTDLGINVTSLLAPSSVVVQALGELNSALAQALSMLSTATNLLGPGLKDAISTAVTPIMIKQATDGIFLESYLDNVAEYARIDAEQAMSKQAMLNEKTKIENALGACTSARNAIGTWLSGYTSSGFQNLPYQVGSGTSSAAQAVANQLWNFISGVEENLKFDKALLDKMTKY
jgi:hypothetical protein